MPDLRVIYELTRIAYSGEDVGEDWTFHVRTGAGLVSFEARVGPAGDDRIRVLGVRERPAPRPDPESSAEFERELWWVSATEHDRGVPDSGVGVYTPVWIPLEPDLEVHRTLSLDVAETGRWTSPERVAHLRLELRARVEALTASQASRPSPPADERPDGLRDADAPAPKLDATPLVPDAPVPRPELTAGELPLLFVTALEGVDVDDLPVHAERVLMVGRDHSDGDPRADALGNFLTHFAGGFMPAWFEPRAAIYELRNLDGQPFWVGRNSSMGQRNNRRIIESFAEAAPPLGRPIAEELGGFEERRSLLVELLGDVHTVDLAGKADALAQLVHALVEQHPDRATVEREVYVRTALIDDVSGEWTHAFIVDPTPFMGPNEHAWLVVWTDSWTE